jgi:hypothetical protein
MKSKNDKKLERVYKICSAAQNKYGYSDQKKEKCVRALKRKFGVKKKD